MEGISVTHPNLSNIDNQKPDRNSDVDYGTRVFGPFVQIGRTLHSQTEVLKDTRRVEWTKRNMEGKGFFGSIGQWICNVCESIGRGLGMIKKDPNVATDLILKQSKSFSEKVLSGVLNGALVKCFKEVGSAMTEAVVISNLSKIRKALETEAERFQPKSNSAEPDGIHEKLLSAAGDIQKASEKFQNNLSILSDFTPEEIKEFPVFVESVTEQITSGDQSLNKETEEKIQKFTKNAEIVLADQPKLKKLSLDLNSIQNDILPKFLEMQKKIEGFKNDPSVVSDEVSFRSSYKDAQGYINRLGDKTLQDMLTLKLSRMYNDFFVKPVKNELKTLENILAEQCKQGNYKISDDIQQTVGNLPSKYPWMNEKGQDFSLSLTTSYSNLKNKLGFLNTMHNIEQGIQNLANPSEQSLEARVDSITSDIKKIQANIRDFSPFDTNKMKDADVFLKQLDVLEKNLKKTAGDVQWKAKQAPVEAAFRHVLEKREAGKTLKNKFDGVVHKNIADMLRAVKKGRDEIAMVREQLTQTGQAFNEKVQKLERQARSTVVGFTSFSSKFLNNYERKPDTEQRNMQERQLMEQFNDGMLKIQSLKQSFETTVKETGKMLEQQFPSAKTQIETFCREHLANVQNICATYEKTLESALKTQINNLYGIKQS